MMPSGRHSNAVFIKHVRIANYLKRLEGDTGVKILAYSSKSRSFSHPPSLPRFSLFSASGWRTCPHLCWDYALYVWISKAFYDKRPHQWPNLSQKQYSSPTQAYFRIRERSIKGTFLDFIQINENVNVFTQSTSSREQGGDILR